MIIITKQNTISDSISLLTKELLTHYNTEKTKKAFLTAFLSQYKPSLYDWGGTKELIILFDSESKEYAFEFNTLPTHYPTDTSKFVCGKQLVISQEEFRFDARTPAIKLLQSVQAKHRAQYKSWDRPERYSFFFVEEKAVVIENWLIRLLKKSVDEFIKTLKLDTIQGANHVKQFLFNKVPANVLSKEETLSLLTRAFSHSSPTEFNKQLWYDYFISFPDRTGYKQVKLSMNSFVDCLRDKECVLELIKGVSDGYSGGAITRSYEQRLLVLIHALSELQLDDKRIVCKNLESILDDDCTEFLRPMLIDAITSVKWSINNKQTQLFIEGFKKLFENDRQTLIKLTDLFIEESIEQADYGLVVCLLSILIGDTDEDKPVFFLREEQLADRTKAARVYLKEVFNGISYELLNYSNHSIVKLVHKPAWLLSDKTNDDTIDHDRWMGKLGFSYSGDLSHVLINNRDQRKNGVCLLANDYNSVRDTLKRMNELMSSTQFSVFNRSENSFKSYQGNTATKESVELFEKQLELPFGRIQSIDWNDYEADDCVAGSYYLSLLLHKKKKSE